MSILDEILFEEYERSLRIVAVIKNELKEIQPGCLIEKKMGKRKYHFLKTTASGKSLCFYVPSSKVEAIQRNIDKRKALENSLKEANKNIKKLETFLEL